MTTININQKTKIIPEIITDSEEKKWFIYPIKIQPHDTDYGGIVWHGNYLKWMETARVEYLQYLGINFADLVKLGCDLPVIEIALRYHKSLKMGMSAIVKTRIIENKGVRINWDYRIESPDQKELYLTGTVTLVPVDIEKGKIMRKLPSILQETINRMKDDKI
jgi:acyl-CoA thioester hydrolase